MAAYGLLHAEIVVVGLGVLEVPQRGPFLNAGEHVVPAFGPEFAGGGIARQILRAVAVARGEEVHGQALVVFAGGVDQFAIAEMRHFDAVQRAFERGLRQFIIAMLERGFPRDIEGFALQPRAQAIGGLPAHADGRRGSGDAVGCGEFAQELGHLGLGPAIGVRFALAARGLGRIHADGYNLFGTL